MHLVDLFQDWLRLTLDIQLKVWYIVYNLLLTFNFSGNYKMESQTQIILTDSGIENLALDIQEVILVGNENIIVRASHNKQNISILYTYESNGIEIAKINTANEVKNVEYVTKNNVEEYFS